MSHVLHRSLLHEPPLAGGGDGVYLVDEDGKRYLDGCGGAAVSCLGHNHPVVAAAIQRQAAELPYAHTAFFSSRVLEELGDVLVGMAPGMGKTMFLSGGSEAMEAALKLSRQYFVETGEESRCLYIARRQSYHGNTLGALSVGGNEWRRRPFASILMPSHHISPCFEYRGREENETAEDYGLRVANELEAKLLELGPENVAAFVAETVVGATSGAVPAVPGYFRRVREICDEYGVHLILDEVMCGSGRTGTFCAYEQEGIVPDIVAHAKGLAAGYQPVGAMLCREQITDAIREGTGFFQHGHTFMGHAIAMAAALATLRVLSGEGVLDKVRKRGASLQNKLRSALGDHANVGEIRGRGLFIGVELVAERDSKKPFEPSLRVNRQIQKAAFENGLMVYAMGGTIDGRHGDHMMIAPPYIIEDAHEDELVDKFASALTQKLPTP